MVCRDICLRIYPKIVVGQSHYSVGKKYCRRCECYFITKEIFCECCGMQLRGSPAERECKEKMRAKKKPITVYNDDDCLGQKMTIDKITVNLYTCYKCNYQWTSWNGNQRAEEPIPKY